MDVNEELPVDKIEMDLEVESNENNNICSRCAMRSPANTIQRAGRSSHARDGTYS